MLCYMSADGHCRPLCKKPASPAGEDGRKHQETSGIVQLVGLLSLDGMAGVELLLWMPCEASQFGATRARPAQPDQEARAACSASKESTGEL